MFLIPIISFGISGVVIAAMLGLKMYQQSHETVLPFIGIRHRLETRTKGIFASAKSGTVSTANAVRSLTPAKVARGIHFDVRALKHKITQTLTAPEHWLDRHTRSLVSLVRGRQTLSERGRPSDFWHKVKHGVDANVTTVANTIQKTVQTVSSVASQNKKKSV